MNKLYLVYILVEPERRYSYVGMTNNFPNRLRQHNHEISGGARYTRRSQRWFPICIIDGFKNKQEAMQCEWAVKYQNRKRRRGKKKQCEQIGDVFTLIERDYWTSRSPLISSQKLTLYVDNEFKHVCRGTVSELWWRCE